MKVPSDLVPNPFLLPESSRARLWSSSNILQVLFMTFLGIAPLRLVFVLLSFIFAVVLVRLSTLGLHHYHSHKDAHNHLRPLPVPRWRLHLTALISRFCIRLVLFACGFLHIRVKGRYDPRARVLVSNHQSLLDGLFIQSQVFASALAKQETQSYPFFGPYLRATQGIFVNRHDPSARSYVIDEIHRRTNDPRFPPLLIFPEGTTTNGTSLLRFKKGAFSSQVPVQPVLLQLPRAPLDLTCPVDTPPLPLLVYLTLCQWSTAVSVHFLPLQYPSYHSSYPADPSLFADRVRSLMAGQLGVFLSPMAVEDCFLWYWLTLNRKNTRLIQGLPPFQVLQERWKGKGNGRKGMDLSKLRKLLEMVMEMDRDQDGMVGKQEWELFWGRAGTDPHQELMEELFERWGGNRNKGLSFMDVLEGIANEPDLIRLPHVFHLE